MGKSSRASSKPEFLSLAFADSYCCPSVQAANVCPGVKHVLLPRRSNASDLEIVCVMRQKIIGKSLNSYPAQLLKPSSLCVACILSSAAMLSGCAQTYPAAYPAPGGLPNAGLAGQPGAAQAAAGAGSVFAQQQTHPQLIELQKQVKQLDANNRDLTSQIAQAQQQAQAFRERSELLARQLEDATQQNKQLLASSQKYADQAKAMQASMTQMEESMRLRGGARLTANNSLNRTNISGLQISGAEIIPEGDSLRIRMSSDQLFAPGSSQLSPSASLTLDQVAGALVRSYPRQRVAVEAHTDTTAVPGGYQGLAQLASAQAQAVINYLARRGGVPTQQLSLSAHGPNRPIADNQSPDGRSQNRRIEIVVSPETY